MNDEEDIPKKVIPLWKEEYRRVYGEEPVDEDEDETI